MKYKLLSLSASISRKMGGVFAVQRNQAIALCHRSVDIAVCGLKDEYSEEDLESWLPVKPSYFEVLGPRQINYSPELRKFINKLECEIIHLHSIWDYPSQIVSKLQTPLVISPNGMLNKEAFTVSGWKKKLALFFYQRKALERASVIQVSTESEMSSIRNLGLQNPIALIGNGVRIPEKLVGMYPPWDQDEKKTLLYLGRIHEKKGIQNMIDAFNSQKDAGFLDNWQLVIVGFGFHSSAFENLLLSKKERYEINDIHLVEGQYGEKMTVCYQNCDAFILPSFNEGLPIAVLEAWANSKPVIITDACNFENAYKVDAAIRIEPTKESIEKGLQVMENFTKEELKNIGRNGLSLVRENYSWDAIAAEYDELYQWVLDPSRKTPKSVIRE
ncbi:glycosyltransferase [Saprospiraceae bacterium]|nr:glycosyltransferase [Saprospiraceae bacterium]